MFDIQRSGDKTILRVWKNLDIKSQAAFERVLGTVAASAACRIVVSLEHCTYCDSAGVNVLLRCATRLGSRLTVVMAPEGLARRVFEACGMQKLVHVAASMREARDEPMRGYPWSLSGFAQLPHYSV